MSWIQETNLSILEKLCLYVIKAGNVPKHIAFIMDGNRRFANKHKVAKATGHSKGFDKLTEVLSWCLDLGVQEVTVYAFSIENFKRSKEEVDQLMELSRKKFKKLLEEKDVLIKEGVNVRFIGDLSLLPKDIFELMAKVVCITKNNKRVRLTVAFSYSGRNEIAESIKCVSKGVLEGTLQSSDVTVGLLEKSLYTEDSFAPDMVVRTSGEVRLSDFMLWQSSCSFLYFTPQLWPEFSLFEFLRGIFHYQRSYDTLSQIKSKEYHMTRNDRTNKFLFDLYKQRFDQMKEVVS